MPDTDESEKRQAENPSIGLVADRVEKRARCQEPDVLVIVGPEQKVFPCYRIVLSLSSAVFDAMLSNSMVENECSRIVVPDVEPDVWKLFYSFFDPRSIRTAEITEDNLNDLVPLFHCYQMMELLEKCDKMLKDIIETIGPLEHSFEEASEKAKLIMEKSLVVILGKIDSIKLIVPFLQREETRDVFWSKIKDYVPEGLDCSNLDALFQNDMFPYLVQARTKSEQAEHVMRKALKFPIELWEAMPPAKVEGKGSDADDLSKQKLQDIMRKAWEGNGIVDLPDTW
ncbi:MAG: hypothetical protein SGARI_006172 [Bacillariaceae sp.]